MNYQFNRRVVQPIYYGPRRIVSTPETGYLYRYDSLNSPTYLYLKAVCPNPAFVIVHPDVRAPEVTGFSKINFDELLAHGYGGAALEELIAADMPDKIESAKDIQDLFTSLGVDFALYPVQA